MPLNGESNELVSILAAEVERARTGIELRGRDRSIVREVCAREAIVERGVLWSIEVDDRV